MAGIIAQANLMLKSKRFSMRKNEGLIHEALHFT